MENAKRQIYCWTAVTGLLALTGYFLLRDQQMFLLLRTIVSVNPLYLLVACFVLFAFFGLEALGLRTLLRSFSYRVKLMRCYRYTLIDFYFSAITPGCCGGQPSQIFFMNRDRIPVGHSSLALLVFNMAYHLSVLLVASFSMLLAANKVFAALGAFRYFLLYGALAQLLLVTLFLFLLFSPRLVPSIVHFLIHGLVKIRLIKREEKALRTVTAQIEHYAAGVNYIRRQPYLLIKVLLITTLHLLALYSLPFWVYRAFGGTEYSIFLLIALQVALTLSVESLPIPGGIGAMEGGFLLIYGGIFSAGALVPALLLCRGFNYYLGLLAGGAAVAFSSCRKHKNNILRLRRGRYPNMVGKFMYVKSGTR